MNEVARQTLARIVTQYGQEVAADPRRCEGLLRDLCGDARREISLLVTAVKERIVFDLQTGAGVPAEVLVSRAIKKMHNNAGIAEDLARWAVESWALALGVVAPETLSRLSQRTKPSSTASPSGKGWYKSRNGSPQQGPFSSIEIQRQAASRELLQTDWLWKDGMAKWITAGSIKVLFPDSAPAPSTQTGTQSLGPPAPSPPLMPQQGLPNPQRNHARKKITAPAISMLIIAALGVLYNGFGTVGILSTAVKTENTSSDSSAMVVVVLFYLSGLVADMVGILGAIRILQLRNYPLAVAGSIAVMYGACVCLCSGIPIGIWSLVMLNKPEVQSSFQ
ncbi:MAG: DUF4339 domain-containing protein [Gemmataceae bacterium]|nr:DUF4339 domain-containing protein [Gemmataceae bacterium]